MNIWVEPLFFNRAIELSDLGKDSDWSNGWGDRWKENPGN